MFVQNLFITTLPFPNTLLRLTLTLLGRMRYNAFSWNFRRRAKILFRSYRQPFNQTVFINTPDSCNCHNVITADRGDKFRLFVIYDLRIGNQILTERKFILKKHVNRFSSIDMVLMMTGAVRAVVGEASLHRE